MIKECEVIYRNEKVSVVKFDNKKIQIPNSDLIGRNVYIRFDKGTYTVVSKNEFEKENIKEIDSIEGLNPILQLKAKQLADFQSSSSSV